MGYENIVYGCIEGANGGPTGYRDLQRRNRQAIAELPGEDDVWPFLTRKMFTVPSETYRAGLYQTQVIHFGASLKLVDQDWAAWIGKFESLLRRLFWHAAVVHLTADWGGRFEYRWRVTGHQINGYREDPPRPPSEWTFDPGPMLFVPYGVDPSDPKAAEQLDTKEDSPE